MADDARGWVWMASSREHRSILVLALCQALHGASIAAYALMLRGLVDTAVAGNTQGFWRWSAAAAALVLMTQALRAVVRWLDERTRAGLENALKLRLFDAILVGDYGRVSAVHSAEWMNRLTNDAKVVADGCVEILPGLASTVARLVGALAMIVWLDPRLSIFMLPGGATLVLLTWLFRRAMKQLHKSIQEADGKLRVCLQERVTGLLTIQSFSVERNALAEVGVLADRHLRARMRRNRFSNLCNVGFGLVMAGAQLGAVVWCSYGILTGALSFGTLTAMAQLVGQAQAPLANVTGYLPRWYAMLASAERLAEAESLTGVRGEAYPLTKVLHLYENELLAVGLSNASYTYWLATDDVAALSREGMLPAASRLSFEVRKGEFLALTGRSGCGKSTALRLLMGAYGLDAGERYMLMDNGTRMLLDGEWRRLFAYVPQGNQLMGGTIREVVSLADAKAIECDERIWSALHIACADVFVRNLPSGIDTLLGERGAGLSEGQMQRIAVARAVFSGSPILLLDEATSALDAPTEARLLENLRELASRTVVVVTHRQAALEVCDRVLRFSGEGVVRC